jgi:fructosamine-3-kinase
MARDKGSMGRDTVQAFERFYNRLDEIFPVERPSLVHGDLWGGNYMSSETGEPVLIDPAVYYGHREMDIGMSRLFGGFAARFYDIYNGVFPLEPGWEERMDYCNIYPLMVHVNLFGGGYLQSVIRILKGF